MKKNLTLPDRLRSSSAHEDRPAGVYWLRATPCANPPRKILILIVALQLGSFAVGIARDIDAVKGAITTRWTTSPVEGQISRVKAIKRQMYGRANYQTPAAESFAGRLIQYAAPKMRNNLKMC